MSDAALHFGIDYGTSASKLVVRDGMAPGGDHAEVVPFDGGVRHPSSVVVLRDELTLGGAAAGRAHEQEAIRYDSVKMRVAAEAKPPGLLPSAVVPELPVGLTSKGLATLSVWSLIGNAREHAEKMLVRRGAAPDTGSPAMTMGIPTSFFEDRVLRRTFWEVLEGARYLEVTRGRAPDRLAVRDAAALAAAADSAAQLAEMPDDLHSLRNELRPEAEAALWWPIRSPAVPPGPYIEFDLGAGTTNASYFRIVQARNDRHGWTADKEKVCFFGAASVPSGMDAVDAAITSSCGLLGRAPADVRGHEHCYLDRLSYDSIQELTSRLYEAVRAAWKCACPGVRRFYPELLAWEGAKIVALGGGSVFPALRDALARHPPSCERRLEVLDLEPPADLYWGRSLVHAKHMPFVAVAYGLANLDPVRTELP